MKQVVVTRHQALVEVLQDLDIISDDVDVIRHVKPDQIRGRRVIGVLPIWLASVAKSVTVADLDIPPEKRGEELSAEELRSYLRGVSTYEVEQVASVGVDARQGVS